MENLLKKKFSSPILGILLFFITVFSAVGCKNQKQPPLSSCLTKEEKADLDYFFRFLMFENYGAFVLFGNKPLCEMYIRDTEAEARDPAFEEWFDSLPQEDRIRIRALQKNKTQAEPDLDRNLYRGWLAWEKVQKSFQMKCYVLKIAPLRGSGGYEVMFIHLQETALILAEHYQIFKNATGMDFDPFQVVLECQNPDSVFWKNVFAVPNHVAKGLLFGFGLRNSIFCDWRLKYSSRETHSESEKRVIDYLKFAYYAVSAKPVKLGQGAPSNFTIPLFGAVEGDEMVKKYLKEKKAIEKIYNGQDLVEVTLQRLAN